MLRKVDDGRRKERDVRGEKWIVEVVEGGREIVNVGGGVVLDCFSEFVCL